MIWLYIGVPCTLFCRHPWIVKPITFVKLGIDQVTFLYILFIYLSQSMNFWIPCPPYPTSIIILMKIGWIDDLGGIV